jgi:hypothetical protein
VYPYWDTRRSQKGEEKNAEKRENILGGSPGSPTRRRLLLKIFVTRFFLLLGKIASRNEIYPIICLEILQSRSFIRLTCLMNR